MTTKQITRTEQADLVRYTLTVDGEQVAFLDIVAATRKVANVETAAGHERQGFARQLWVAANAEAECFHSVAHHRTALGDIFAEAVGGRTIDAELDVVADCGTCCGDIYLRRPGLQLRLLTPRGVSEMQDHEMLGLLGPAYDETTEEQRRIIDQACDKIAARWPDEPDWRDEHTDALNGTLEVVLGDATADEVVADWRTARDAERAAHRRLTGAIIAEALAGATETALAERLHLTRMTVRKALGK